MVNGRNQAPDGSWIASANSAPSHSSQATVGQFSAQTMLRTSGTLAKIVASIRVLALAYSMGRPLAHAVDSAQMVATPGCPTYGTYPHTPSVKSFTRYDQASLLAATDSTVAWTGPGAPGS